MKQKQKRIFLWFHILLLACIPLFYFYRSIIDRLPSFLFGCFMHDFLFLYCPLCGGTRAVDALLHFDFPAAIRSNLFVVVVALTALVFYVLAWVRLIKKKDRLVVIPNYLWIVFAIFLVLFSVIRNLLLIYEGFDPLGDLLPIWSR